MSQVGSHPLTGTGDLPNVTVTFPGEHWSDAVVASGRAIVPGEAVIVVSSGGRLSVRPVVAGDNNDPRVGIATRPIDVPDAEHPRALGPTEIRNQDIEIGDYCHRYQSGAFALTLVDPRREYEPGQLIGWDIDGERPVGKSGTGSWTTNTFADVDSIFEVQFVREYGSAGEVILNVRSVKGQF